MDYELLPGVVVSVEDKQHLGRIKVALPSGESTSNTQLEAMPWCYPLTMTGTYQGFTKLVDNCKVWVFRNKLDKLEMWYIPMMDLNPNTEEIVSSYDNVDVLISRDLGGQNVYIYYTDSKGIMLSIGSTKININDKGEIDLTTGEGSIKITGENVLINTDETSNHAVRCEPLMDCLNKIKDCLTAIQEASTSNPYTNPIFGKLSEPLASLNSMLSDNPVWKSDNVFIN